MNSVPLLINLRFSYMPVDYDLVVIGNTPAGIHAAVSAAQLNARVAIVEQATHPDSTIVRRTFAEIGDISQRLDRANQLSFYASEMVPEAPQLTEVKKWADAIAASLQELESPAVLASLGIEFIASIGEFCRKPFSGFVVNGRVLRSRAFLIATAQIPLIPKIEGLQTTDYLTPETLGQMIPSKLVIIGDDEIGIELAQTLTQLGSHVTLIVSRGMLETADREVAFLIQSQLEAEGIRVLTHTHVTQVRTIQSKKWVQAGDEAIETDEILLAAGSQPNLEFLNLEAMGVSFPVRVNTKLQTLNNRIYVCGSRIHPIAQKEANIALKNALFFPLFKINDGQISQVVFTNPQLTWVGLTESQAIRVYRKDVVVVRQFFKPLAKAHIQNKLTGIFKIITRRNGEILGAHIVGTDASELIGTIALAMNQKLKIQSFRDLAIPSPTFSEILMRVAIAWDSQRLKHNTRLQDFLEEFFRWRRARSRY